MGQLAYALVTDFSQIFILLIYISIVNYLQLQLSMYNKYLYTDTHLCSLPTSNLHITDGQIESKFLRLKKAHPFLTHWVC